MKTPARRNADSVAEEFEQFRHEVDLAWRHSASIPELNLKYVHDVYDAQEWNSASPKVMVLRCRNLPVNRHEKHWEQEARQSLNVTSAELSFKYTECAPGQCLHTGVEFQAPQAEAWNTTRYAASRWLEVRRVDRLAGNAHPGWYRVLPIRPEYVIEFRRDTELCDASVSFPMTDISRVAFAQGTLTMSGDLMIRSCRGDYEITLSPGKSYDSSGTTLDTSLPSKVSSTTQTDFTAPVTASENSPAKPTTSPKPRASRIVVGQTWVTAGHSGTMRFGPLSSDQRVVIEYTLATAGEVSAAS